MKQIIGKTSSSCCGYRLRKFNFTTAKSITNIDVCRFPPSSLQANLHCGVLPSTDYSLGKDLPKIKSTKCKIFVFFNLFHATMLGKWSKSTYYAWYMPSLSVHACIAGCNVAIVKLVSLVPRLPPTTLVPLGPSKSHATIAMWWRQGYPQLLPLHTSPLNLYSFILSPI